MTEARSALPPPDVIRALPADGGPEFNRLIHATSPYLLQHARNPVDWYPWGAEALERAKREDKPVFLSVGYSSCHWCHVMEHESFERDDVAELLNRHFVCIKVDREERPDLDDVYMTATQLMTGRGGWPNSVWLLPDGRPWYAGTYFPREDRAGQPGFKTLLLRLAEVWTTRRADVEEQARRLSDAIRQNAELTGLAPAASTTASDLAELALHRFEETFDLQHGGFGGAPKFPPHTALVLLLSLRGDHAQRARPLITGTLDAMQRGGIHDHIGGGFHRYSTDERWLVPHFEKMLYDNAQLARNFAAAWALTGDAAYRATACDTLDWVLREMTGSEGGFHTALDADSEGEEGRFYVWSHEEILSVLGPDDGPRFCAAYNIRPEGNFHDEATGRPTGLNIVHSSAATDDATLSQGRARLLDVRSKRVGPMLDDKVLTGWNGLMIGALAFAGKAFDEPRYVAAAERAARFFLGAMMPGGRLLRVWRAGQARVPGFLEDHAALADGLLDLHEATGAAEWLDAARRLAADFIERFSDAKSGGFFSTADGHEALITRVRDTFDQAMPSATSLAIRVLARLAKITGEASWRERASRAVAVVAPLMHRLPTGTAALIHAALLLEEPAGDTQGVPAPQRTAQPVEVHFDHQTRTVTPGQTVDVVAHLRIAQGWHAREVALKIAGDFALVETRPPPAGDATGYAGEVAIPCRLRAAARLNGRFAVAQVTLAWQPCDDTACHAPASHSEELVFRVA